MIGDDEVAAARRELGLSLARYRAAKGLSQWRLAPMVSYSRSTLANAETGCRTAGRDFWWRCDQILAAGGTLVRQYDELESLRQVHRERAVRLSQAERQARAAHSRQQQGTGGVIDRLLPGGEAGWPVDTLAALDELGSADLGIERRRILSAAALSLAAVTAPGSGWWTQQATKAMDRPASSTRKVGRRDLEAMRDMVAMFSRIDQRHGGGHARTAIVQYLTTDVSTCIRGRFVDDAVRREAFSTASELAYLSGWMAFDNGKHALAQPYFTAAVGLAAEADDAPMAGHVLRAMAHQAVDVGHRGQALDLATASVEGRRYAMAASRERALLGVVLARALALAGQAKAAVAALSRAERDLAAAKPGDGEPGRVFFFGEASLAHETACTLRDLGDLNGAQREFQRSVRTRKASSFTRTHAVTLGYLGDVQIRTGAVEQACDTWSRALDAMDGLRSARTRHAVADMRRALEPLRGRGIAAAAELDYRAAVHLAESA